MVAIAAFWSASLLDKPAAPPTILLPPLLDKPAVPLAMPFLDRRAFLRSSLAGAAGLPLVAGFDDGLFAADAEPRADATRSAAEPFAPDSLFLSWQRDPTSTMTIQWVGAAPAEASIRYVQRDGEAWNTEKVVSKPFPGADLVVNRCELSRLEEGTDYIFQLGKTSRMYRFRTMPAKATNTIQFVSGGDCGTNRHAIGTNVLAAKQEPYFALIGGDLAYDNGRSPQTVLAFLRNYSRHMVDPKGRLIPLIAGIGNHEVDGGYKKKREKAPQFLSLFDGLYAETTYGVLDIGDYLSLVLLDTGHIAPIGGEQTVWLEKVLTDRRERPHLFVANHVPAYPSYRAPEGKNGGLGAGEANRLHWCPLFEDLKVDAVFEHHDHTFKRTHPIIDGRIDQNGVLYLGDGSWGKLRAPKKPEERPYLAAVGEAYHMSVHRLEGERRFHVALEESGRVADVCTSSGKRPSKRG